jgi:hypothetical protein
MCLGEWFGEFGINHSLTIGCNAFQNMIHM